MREMLNKEGLATRRVAFALCSVSPGERIPTVSELERTCGASRGYVQRALANLKESGAVRLEAHGQSGTVLVGIDYLALVRACGVTHIVGAMPLPYTTRYEGLATSLFTLLNEGGVHAYITFQRGSEGRLQTLLDEATDYCVMSRLAYREYVLRGFEVEAALDCGPSSYVGRHVLFSRDADRTDWTGARVGIDDSSVDQKILTERCFSGFDVEYVPVQYTHIVEMLRRGELDAGIWNEDDVHMRYPDLSTRELGEKGADIDNTCAVIVVRSGDALTRQVIRTLVNAERVRSIQSQVMDGSIPVRY